MKKNFDVNHREENNGKNITTAEAIFVAYTA